MTPPLKWADMDTVQTVVRALRSAGEVALVVRDDYHGQGVGTELLSYLTQLAQQNGLLGFTAEVLLENRAMLSLFERMGFDIQRRTESGVFELRMKFKGTP